MHVMSAYRWPHHDIGARSGHRMLPGKAYYKLFRYDDAITQWKKALELDPRNTAAQKNIEMAQRRMGR